MNTTPKKYSDGTVTLRILSAPKDITPLTKICLDPTSILWTTVPLNYTTNDALEYIKVIAPKGWDSGNTRIFGITNTETDKLLGTIELRVLQNNTIGEIGINLSSSSRGSGTAYRAVQLILDYAFKELYLHRINWICAAGNWASLKLAIKCGFYFEGTIISGFQQRQISKDAWRLVLEKSFKTFS